MSLVAAVAVAGLTTTSSAANLEDAIKGTKLTGYVRYRLNTDHENSTDMTEEGKIVAKITTPVNDVVTANVKTVSFAETKSANTTADTAVTEANFVINAAGATVIAGLQTSQSPFFANNGDTRSHGVTALIPAGPVTVAAAYYTTSVAKGMVGAPAAGALANNVAAIGALGKFGAVNVNAWYASVEDGADVDDVTLAGVAALDDASALSLQVTAAAGPVDVEAMMTQVSNGDADMGVTKLVATGKAGNVSYMAAYAMSNEDGGMVALDADSDSIADIGLDNLNMAATADATAFALSAKVAMESGVCASIAYLDGSSDAHADFDELDLKVGYQMGKNFKASLLYAMGDAMGADFGYSQIEVKYTF